MLIGKVLGLTEVESAGGRIELGGPQPRRLVGALLAAEGRLVSEGSLAEAIWGDAPPANPTVSLQAYVSRLRRAFGGAREALERVGDGYRLRINETDASRFASGVQRARALLDEGRPGEALRAFDGALSLWRGEAFADLPDFAVAARTRLAELRAVAVEERLAARVAGGDAPGAVGELESSVRAEPYRERRWELLILALYRSGRQADALVAVRRVRTVLADGLGIDPGPALQQLERRLLAQDPRLLLPARPAPAVRPLSAFLGRTAELAALAELMSTSRLVTLVGPGGAGKTRLAVEYTAGPSWFVRLADVTAAELVVPAVATALGVRGPTADAITGALAEWSGLLVLDNCEHLVVPVADLVLHLLAACPGVRVLATSRESLGIDGERLLPVAPLPEADAVALLTDRITAIRPGWRPDPAEKARLAGIASALDGIPLALELAAARARVLSLSEIGELLHDRFPALGPVPRGALAPHETLEAAVAWSVDLLPSAERALLLRLWPFEGGFTMAAVGADLSALSGLVARSVVVADPVVTPARYQLLGIVRAYCRGRDPDPVGSRAAHAAWVRALVEHWAPGLHDQRSAHAIRLLNRELPNLRTGIEHDLAVAPEAALRTAASLEWFWFRGGHVSEGLRLLTAALAGAPQAPAADRARAWAASGILRFLAGDLADAADCIEQTYATLGVPTDRDGRILHAHVLYYESMLCSLSGHFGRAVGLARESIAAARDYGEDWIVPAAVVCLGSALAALGDGAAGRQALADAIRQATELNQVWPTALGELALGRAMLVTDPHGALAALHRAVQLFRDEDDIGNVLSCLHTAAYALALAGRAQQAGVLLAAVRRHAVRRGLDLEAMNPVDAVSVNMADPQGVELDEAEMIAFLDDARLANP